MHRLSEFIVGLVFGLGLLLSGITDPGNVLGFLDLFAERGGRCVQRSERRLVKQAKSLAFETLNLRHALVQQLLESFSFNKLKTDHADHHCNDEDQCLCLTRGHRD